MCEVTGDSLAATVAAARPLESDEMTAESRAAKASRSFSPAGAGTAPALEPIVEKEDIKLLITLDVDSSDSSDRVSSQLSRRVDRNLNEQGKNP